MTCVLDPSVMHVYANSLRLFRERREEYLGERVRDEVELFPKRTRIFAYLFSGGHLDERIEATLISDH